MGVLTGPNRPFGLTINLLNASTESFSFSPLNLDATLFRKEAVSHQLSAFSSCVRALEADR
jgi:hypothetical protein